MNNINKNTDKEIEKIQEMLDEVKDLGSTDQLIYWSLYYMKTKPYLSISEAVRAGIDDWYYNDGS